MPTLTDYETFFDSIGIDDKKRTILVSELPEIPKHGADLPSEWHNFEFADGIEILAGPEESAWLQTICRIQPKSVTVPNDARGITHFCQMPGRKLWFRVVDDPEADGSSPSGKATAFEADTAGSTPADPAKEILMSEGG